MGHPRPRGPEVGEGGCGRGGSPEWAPGPGHCGDFSGGRLFSSECAARALCWGRLCRGEVFVACRTRSGWFARFSCCEMGGFGSVRSCPAVSAGGWVGKLGDVVNLSVSGTGEAVTLPRPFHTRRFWVMGKP